MVKVNCQGLTSFLQYQQQRRGNKGQEGEEVLKEGKLHHHHTRCLATISCPPSSLSNNNKAPHPRLSSSNIRRSLTYGSGSSSHRSHI